MRGTWGWKRSGRVRVLDRCIFVGCRNGGGASVRIGIEVSPRGAPGRLTKDFVNVVLREGMVANECGDQG